MKIAVIGTGIAGNVAAYHLSREHQVTVFEANEYVGGHTHTHDVEWEGKRYRLDTGFIVFNYRTYPHFTRLLRELEVPVQTSAMSFSVTCDRSGLEYNGSTLNGLFAQRRNLFRPAFYRVLRDILRFHREAPDWLFHGDTATTLGEYLRQQRYTREFIEWYVIPMGSAIWSAGPGQTSQMPAQFFIRFLHNHGMLQLTSRPMWYVVRGGSREYVRKLTAPFHDRIRTGCKVAGIRRSRQSVWVTVDGHAAEEFDRVFIATHSDQALRLLEDATPLEKAVLGAIPYQENEAVLHTDNRLLPTRRHAWAAWNYRIPLGQQERVAATYNLNILQGIAAPVQFCVTLNSGHTISPQKVIARMVYHHPVFTAQAVQAQQRQVDLNGTNRTYYCGAYWRYGFHEDGVVSALNALEHFRRKEHDAQLSLRGTHPPSAA
jgi:predicted NAD/FAD-binding protein